MSRQRQKGTSFESSLLPLLKQYYRDASRAPLRGTKDTGDFVLPGERRFILEAKNVARMNLAGWVDEADTEAYNAWREWQDAAPPVGVVVHKRKGTTEPGDQYVTTTLSGFLRLVNGQ